MLENFNRRVSAIAISLLSSSSFLGSISYAIPPTFSIEAVEEKLNHKLRTLNENIVVLSLTELCDFYELKGESLSERLAYLKDPSFSEFPKYCPYTFYVDCLNGKATIMLAINILVGAINYYRSHDTHIFDFLPKDKNLTVLISVTPEEYLQLEKAWGVDVNYRESLLKNFEKLLNEVNETEKRLTSSEIQNEVNETEKRLTSSEIQNEVNETEKKLISSEIQKNHQKVVEASNSESCLNGKNLLIGGLFAFVVGLGLYNLV